VYGEDNIKVDFKDGIGGVDGIHLAQVRDKWQVFVYTVMKTVVP